MKTSFNNRRNRQPGNQHLGNVYVHKIPTVRRLNAFTDETSSHGLGIHCKGPIDRYLNAPLSDEPASAPAINAALRNQPSSHILSPANSDRYPSNTSIEAHSEGRRTFFTSEGALETASPVCSQDRRIMPSTGARRRSNTYTSGRWTPVEHGIGDLSTRPTTSDAIGSMSSNGMIREWPEGVESLPPTQSDKHCLGRSSSAVTAAKVLNLEEMTKELEVLVQQYKAGHGSQTCRSKVTNASAHVLMAANSKAVWLLGDHAVDARVRPRSIVSIFNAACHRPSTAPNSSLKPTDNIPQRDTSIHSSANVHREAASLPRPRTSTDTHSVSQSRYYCTFCQKCFDLRPEWLRHERAVHIQEKPSVYRPRTGQSSKRSPSQKSRSPSPFHRAGHGYLPLQEKASSELTLANKDQSLQRVSQVLGLWPNQSSGRLTELFEAWSQPSAVPVNIGHKALHCGFCGATFKSYEERTAHVGQHYSDGVDIMSWWPERVSHDVNLLETRINAPSRSSMHQCLYCSRTFRDLATAQKLHATCAMWSCSFLPGLPHTIHETVAKGQVESVCCFCSNSLARGAEGKVNIADLKSHMVQHNFRACDQKAYYSAQRFRQHLQNSHKISHDSSLFAGWTLLLKSCRRERPSVFVQASERPSPGPVSFDTELATERATTSSTDAKPEPVPKNFMDLSDRPKRREPNKLRRKASNIPAAKQSNPELRGPTPSCSRPATAPSQPATASAANGSRSHGNCLPFSGKPKDKLDAATTPALSGERGCPAFFRKRLDASMRNRLYLAEGDQPFTSPSQQHYMKMPGSTVGSLILYSSQIAALPARLTNSVDIYTL